MERAVREVDTAVLLEGYRELLEQVDTLPLLVSGNSMVPFLVHGRDTVYLTKAVGPMKRGDMVLYQRRNGAYILHRIYACKGDLFDMVGDAQIQIEHGIAAEQIFAVVRSAVRKGRVQEPGCFWWDFFEKVWIRIVPLRPVVMRVYSMMDRLFRRKI